MMTTTMKIIKNGIEEESEVYCYKSINIDDDNIIGVRQPVLKSNEECHFTICGKCYIYETIEDKQ